MNANAATQEQGSPPGAEVVREAGRLLRNLRFGPQRSAYAHGSHCAIHILPRLDNERKTITAYVTCFAYGHRAVGWAGLPIPLECADAAAAGGFYLEFLNARGQVVFADLPAAEYAVGLLPVEEPEPTPQRYETVSGTGSAAVGGPTPLGTIPATFARPRHPLTQGHVEVLSQAPFVSSEGELVIEIRIPEPYCDPGTAVEVVMLAEPAGPPLAAPMAVKAGQLKVLHVRLPQEFQEEWRSIAATRWEQLPLRFVVRSPTPPASG